MSFDHTFFHSFFAFFFDFACFFLQHAASHARAHQNFAPSVPRSCTIIIAPLSISNQSGRTPFTMTKNKDARAPREGLDKNKSGWTSMPVLNESEIEAVTDTYTQEDQARSKTWSRRIVENYLQHVSEAYCLLYDDEF